MDLPLIGSYDLEAKPHSVQRTVNLIPVPQEPGNERTGWVLKDVKGLDTFNVADVVYPPHLWNPAIGTEGYVTISDDGSLATKINNAIFTVRNAIGLTQITAASAKKVYCEFVITLDPGGDAGMPAVGICNQGGDGLSGLSDCLLYLPTGAIYLNAAPNGTTYTGYTTGSVIGCALDAATGKVWFSLAGTFNGSPTAGTGQAATLSGTDYYAVAAMYDVGDAVTLRTLASEFQYLIPSGFEAMSNVSPL